MDESGNQTLAAEKAAVSRSWVCKERGLNAGFDSKVRAAIAAARTERRFLAAAGATVNVKATCAEVGKSFGSAYARRNRWPGFAGAGTRCSMSAPTSSRSGCISGRRISAPRPSR